MIESEVIIIGGGPAGSSCAWKLKQAGIETLVLDKHEFPRTKVCAGWITPEVFSDLDLDPADYPFSLTTYGRITFHLKGVPIPVKTRQYAVRRHEFDDFLLKRTGAGIHLHTASRIRVHKGRYEIDDAYRCRYLVGAGGTHCPVYRTFFRTGKSRAPAERIDAAETEFPCAVKDAACRLWFFDNGLPGYSWFVPKEGGWLNVGIGGRASSMRKKGINIRGHWNRFAKMLSRTKLAEGLPAPRGHVYYLRRRSGQVRLGNAFITGDAAGLATRDLGEGIGPAVRSGLAAARSIITGGPYTLAGISRWSMPGILMSR